MNIEEAIDIIDKELHKKWDKKVHKDNNGTHIILSEEVPLNEFEIASQRCLVEVQRLNNIINELEILVECLYLKVTLNEDQEELLNRVLWGSDEDARAILLSILKGEDNEKIRRN